MDRCGRCVCRDGCGGWRLDMSLVQGGLYLSSKNAGLGFTDKSAISFSKFLFHEFMDQYQACLYSVECISYGDPNMVI